MRKVRVQCVATPEQGFISEAMRLAVRRMNRVIFTNFNDELNRPNFWWIIFVGNQPAGYAGMRLVDGGSSAFLSLCGIVKKYRGRGFQRKLIGIREMRARKLGCPDILTYSAGWNHASSNNLIARGYHLYEPTAPFGCDGALYFRKKIID